MKESSRLVVFTLDEQRYALHLSAVERIIRSVEVTPLPKAPEVVLGVINLRGQILPVVNIRRRFHLPEREIALSDHFIVAQTARRTVVLVADAVGGVVEASEEDVTTAETVLPGVEYVQGILKLDDGIVLIHDLDTFLSLDEEQALDEAMK